MTSNVIASSDDSGSEDDDLEKRRDVVRDTRYLPQSSPINLLASPESRMDHRVLSETSPPADRLKDCQVRAERLSSRKKADRAIREYVRCVTLSRIVHGDTHWLLAKAHADLAEAYFDLSGYAAQAICHLETAERIMLGMFHHLGTSQEKADFNKVLVNVYCTLGRALTKIRKFNEAETALLKAERISGEFCVAGIVSDPECDRLDVTLYLAIARLYSRQRKYAEFADQKFEKVIDLVERVDGRDCLQLVPILIEYGKFQQDKGRHADSDSVLNILHHAHDVAMATHKSGSDVTMETGLALARAYASTGEEGAEASAESYLNECLCVCSTIHTSRHPQMLMLQDELCKLMIRTGRHQDATRMLKSGLAAKQETFGDYSESVSDTHKLIACVYMSAGDVESAFCAFKKCYAIEQAVFGNRHRKSVNTLRTMQQLTRSRVTGKTFVISADDRLKKRPRFNNIVRSSPRSGS